MFQKWLSPPRYLIFARFFVITPLPIRRFYLSHSWAQLECLRVDRSRSDACAVKLLVGAGHVVFGVIMILILTYIVRIVSSNVVYSTDLEEYTRHRAFNSGNISWLNNWFASFLQLADIAAKVFGTYTADKVRVWVLRRSVDQRLFLQLTTALALRLTTARSSCEKCKTSLWIRRPRTLSTFRFVNDLLPRSIFINTHSFMSSSS